MFHKHKTLVVGGILVNLRPAGVLRWKAEDNRLERSRSVTWKASTSKIVASTCVG
jgi:hypothetical protein